MTLWEEEMLRLPHPERAALIDAVKRNLVGKRHSVVAGVELCYAVFSPGLETPDFAFYDEDETIYIPEDLVRVDPQFAELIALHEHLEIQHKSAGRSHAYAHRRALVEELLAAKRLFGEPSELRCYLGWRIGLYPEWKVPHRAEVAAQFARLLAADKPRKGELLRAVKEHRL